MDKKLIFAGAFGLLFLGVLVWFLFFRKNPVSGKPIVDVSKKDDKPATQPTKTVTNTVYVNSGGGGNARNDNFPLKQGSYGEKVKQIQAKLKITADGDWGPGTQAALMKAGITSGFADQAALDKWLNPIADTTISTASAGASTSSKYDQRDSKYMGKWGFTEPVDVYENVQTADRYKNESAGSKIVTSFQPSVPVSNNSFYGMGKLKNGYLKVRYNSSFGGFGGDFGWVLFSKLTQIEKSGLINFDGENNQNRKRTKNIY